MSRLSSDEHGVAQDMAVEMGEATRLPSSGRPGPQGCPSHREGAMENTQHATTAPLLKKEMKKSDNGAELRTPLRGLLSVGGCDLTVGEPGRNEARKNREEKGQERDERQTTTVGRES